VLTKNIMSVQIIMLIVNPFKPLKEILIIEKSNFFWIYKENKKVQFQKIFVYVKKTVHILKLNPNYLISMFIVK